MTDRESERGRRNDGWYKLCFYSYYESYCVFCWVVFRVFHALQWFSVIRARPFVWLLIWKRATNFKGLLQHANDSAIFHSTICESAEGNGLSFVWQHFDSRRWKIFYCFFFLWNCEWGRIVVHKLCRKFRSLLKYLLNNKMTTKNIIFDALFLGRIQVINKWIFN